MLRIWKFPKMKCVKQVKLLSKTKGVQSRSNRSAVGQVTHLTHPISIPKVSGFWPTWTGPKPDTVHFGQQPTGLPRPGVQVSPASWPHQPARRATDAKQPTAQRNLSIWSSDASFPLVPSFSMLFELLKVRNLLRFSWRSIDWLQDSKWDPHIQDIDWKEACNNLFSSSSRYLWVVPFLFEMYWDTKFYGFHCLEVT